MSNDVATMALSCEQVHNTVDSFARGHLQYPIDRLKRIALSGTFITPETLEAIWLKNDAAVLRAMADELDGIRAKLIANEKLLTILAAG